MPDELAYLLHDADVQAVVYDSDLSDRVEAVRTRTTGVKLWVQAGGTTGMPKAVVGRVGPGVQGMLVAAPAGLGEAPLSTVEEAAALAGRLADEDRRHVSLPACPLIHATAAVIGMQAPLMLGGATVLLSWNVGRSASTRAARRSSPRRWRKLPRDIRG